VAENHKVVVNLATGLEDAERVTVAFLVAGAALEQGKQVAIFLTKEAVRLALPGFADAVRATAARPSRNCSSSTLTAASCSSAQSASKRASSTRARSSATPGSPAQRRYGNGSAKAPPSSATKQAESPPPCNAAEPEPSAGAQGRRGA
jgi:sulfur relay (sulfurtransferase) complex TusBCD TusD component (DsrE family)